MLPSNSQSHLSRGLSLAFGALTVTILVAVGTVRATEPAQPQDLDSLKAALRQALSEYHIPGLGVAMVARDKDIWVGGIGKADLASGKDMGPDTMFRLGSVTKSFVALAMIQLCEQGKISLDAQLSKIAPEVPVANQWEASRPITVADLLEHTAGFDEFPLHTSYDFDSGGHAPLLEILKKNPNPLHVMWPPGTRFAYTNTDYAVVAYLIEKTSGEPFEKYIAEHILRPVGMNLTGFELNPEIKANLAQGYEGNPPRPVPYFPALLRPADQMMSSPDEMALFVRMMLNGGELNSLRIVSAASLARMETPTNSMAAQSGMRVGYGAGIMIEPGKRIVTYGHDGGMEDFLARYVYLPNAGVGYFFAINTASALPGYARIDQLLFDFITRGLPDQTKVAPAELPRDIQKWVGFYAPAAVTRARLNFWILLIGGMRVSLHDGVVYRAPIVGGEPVRLIPLGDYRFRTAIDPVATTVFTRDADGKPIMVAELTPTIPIAIYYQQMDGLWPGMRLALLVLAFLLMASSIPFALIWIPRKILGQMKSARHLMVRIAPLLAVATFIAFVFVARSATPLEVMRLSARSFALCALSLAFALLSFFALILSLRSFRFEMNRLARIHSIAVALACSIVSVYFLSFGLIPLMLWTL